MMFLGTVSGPPGTVEPLLDSLHTQKRLHPVQAPAVAVSFTEAINNTVACFQNGRFVSPWTVRLKQVTHAAFACAPAFESLLLFYPQLRVQPAN